MAVKGDDRRKFDLVDSFEIPGGGFMDIRMSARGEIKLLFNGRRYKIEALQRGGDFSEQKAALTLVPDPLRKPRRAAPRTRRPASRR
jgi:hypothetical protein